MSQSRGYVGQRAADLGAPRSRPAISNLKLTSSAIASSLTGGGEVRQHIKYLEDLVARLQTELRRAQEKIPDYVSPQLSEADLDSVAPWQLNAQQMGPLLIAYESRVQELTSQLDAQQTEVASLARSHQELIEENEQLHNQLKDRLDEAVNAQKAALTSGDASASVPSANAVLGRDGAESTEVHERLELLTAENDTLVELHKEMSSELDRLRNQNSELAKTRNAFEKEARQAREFQLEAQDITLTLQHQKGAAEAEMARFAAELGVAEKEKADMNEEMRRMKRELHKHSQSVSEYKQALEELRQQSGLEKDAYVRETNTLIQRERDMAASASKIEQDFEVTLEENRQLSRRLQDSGSEISDLNNAIVTLESKLMSYQERETESQGRVADTLDQMEALKLERDQAMAREQTEKNEVERLTKKLNAQISETAARTEAGIQNVKEEYEATVSRLREEVQTLDLTSTDLQSRLDKAMRDKRSLESEIERQRKMADKSKVASVIDDLGHKLGIAERERDDLQHQISGSRAQVKRAQGLLEEERAQFDSTKAEMQRRAHRLENDINDQRNQREILAAQLSDLKQENRALQTQVNELTQKATTAREHSTSQIRILEDKLDQAYTSKQRSATELKELLDAREKLTQKYRVESETSTRKFEKIINTLHTDVERLTGQVGTLQGELARHKADKASSGSKVSEFEKENHRLRIGLNSSEERVTDLRRQLANLFQSESRLLIERKEMQAKVDRLTLHLERVLRERDSHSGRLAEAQRLIGTFGADPKPPTIHRVNAAEAKAAAASVAPQRESENVPPSAAQESAREGSVYSSLKSSGKPSVPSDDTASRQSSEPSPKQERAPVSAVDPLPKRAEPLQPVSKPAGGALPSISPMSGGSALPPLKGQGQSKLAPLEPPSEPSEEEISEDIEEMLETYSDDFQ